MQRPKKQLEHRKPFVRFAHSIWRFVRQPYIASAALALVITVLSFTIQFSSTEAALYDLRMRWKVSDVADSRIYVLSTHDWNADPRNVNVGIKDHLSSLKKLIKQKPAAIAFLNYFDPSDIQLNWKAAEEFVEVAEDAIGEGVKVYIGTDIYTEGEILAPYPLSLLPHYPAVLHKDGIMFAKDKVVRRVNLTVFQKNSLHLRLASDTEKDSDLLRNMQDVRGAYYYDAADSWQTLIRYPGDTSWHANTFKTATYDTISSQPEYEFKGKVILVGSVFRESMDSFISTPYSKEPFVNPKLFVHASIVDTLLKDSGIKIIPGFIEMLLTFAFTIGLIFVTIRLSPSQGIVFLIAAFSFLFILSLVLLDQLGFWMRLANPYFAIFCTYCLVVPYRARLEYKERWKVQEKHDVLLQVEEMKGNFLSLMSHDLKTPVARIQGLAELIDRQGNLNDKQKEGVEEILNTTDNLNKFISKILNLTKVESSEIKLNLRSKDINKVIEICLEKLSFHAQAKQILIKTDLEPLFPIQIDSALIVQVLTNLIDNAIKYSPVGSTITIRSREIDSYVDVSVIDEGAGLDEDERKQLFTKFYRGKNPAGSEIKGSGLGLYLSKYFIELHQGKITVESEPKKGSQFKVSLPIELTL